MEQHAGIDVSLEWSSVCIADASGKIVREIKVASEPEVLVEFFKGLSLPVTRIGLEAGPLSQWLQGGAFSDVDKNGSQRRARDRPAHAHGVVPARTRQVGRLARGASVAGRAQAATFEAYGS